MKCACSTVLMAMFALASAARAQEGSAAARNSGGDASAAALATPVPPVHYYPKQQVDAGFDSKAGGDMLYNGDGGTRNFTLMTGVRTNPGGGELHMKSTDVIYVVKGSATLVTGGRIAGVEENAINPNTGKPFPKDEIRGKGVEGGEPHHLAAGDVIIVPNGVPHQFSEVEGEFCYHLIKIRQP
jgi:mannose-6-phosphate isomerase-like protein (cupin superfamily)